MSTLESMHRLVAKHPMVQAELFILMETLLHSELLCMQGVFLGSIGMNLEGSWSLGAAKSMPKIEDEWASTSEPGLANFVRAGL